MISAAWERSRALLAAGEFDEVERVLREAAEGGDVDAALELGWLLSLSAVSWDELYEMDDDSWEPERWLLGAVEMRPDDPGALLPLAGLWARLAHPTDVGLRGDDGRTGADLRQRAVRQYDRVLAIQPGHRSANAGLLAVQAADDEDWGGDAADAGFSFFRLTAETEVSNNGDMLLETVVLSDSVDLRWALHQFANRSGDWLPDSAAVTVFQRGEPATTIDLKDDPSEWRWADLQIPALAAPALPRWHPVRIDGWTHHFGYNAIMS